MGSHQQGLREPPELRAVYSVGKLARIGNVNADLLRRLLRSNGVALLRGGRSFYVALSDIQEKIPPLWESLCLTEEIRRAGGRTGGERGHVARKASSDPVRISRS
jgi:hypothetical protein